ncbi:MAG TPA: PilZ domain-containing protein [Gammaproteobacteria bacterium]|nr:PilZ domain-containing protein [Gammaproteobacteria bacterium]
MNHRCCRRESVDISMRLHVADSQSHAARITNLSHGGAYIEIDSPHRFPVDGIVRLEVPLHKADESTSINTQGLVIHNDTNGLGLMFVDESTGFVQTLCKHCHTD